MADKCFRKCISYPSSELDTKETVSDYAVFSAVLLIFHGCVFLKFTVSEISLTDLSLSYVFATCFM